VFVCVCVCVFVCVCVCVCVCVIRRVPAALGYGHRGVHRRNYNAGRGGRSDVSACLRTCCSLYACTLTVAVHDTEIFLVQVCDAVGYAEGFSITSGVRRNIARAIPLHLQHASEEFGEEVKVFHCVDCRWCKTCNACGLCDVRSHVTFCSDADAEYERSIAMFLHATAAEGLADKPDVSVKWVHSRDLNVSDDGTIRDLEGVRVRCVWKSASWRYLCSVPQPDIVAKLLYSPQVHVYQVPSTALKAFILIYFDAFFWFLFFTRGRRTL
jgi:hypothetical protein